jgi:hypothetical protein
MKAAEAMQRFWDALRTCAESGCNRPPRALDGTMSIFSKHPDSVYCTDHRWKPQTQ